MGSIIRALKMMYNMERFATAIYRAQIRAFREEDMVDRLNAASANEQQHVDTLKSQGAKLKGSTSRVGLLFQFAGTISGFVISFFGKISILRIDVWIEKRAIKDYGNYMQRLKFDEETMGLLKQIVADEERHVETWQDSIAKIKQQTA